MLFLDEITNDEYAGDAMIKETLQMEQINTDADASIRGIGLQKDSRLNFSSYGCLFPHDSPLKQRFETSS